MIEQEDTMIVLEEDSVRIDSTEPGTAQAVPQQDYL
jgi:hypothetical protein